MHTRPNILTTTMSVKDDEKLKGGADFWDWQPRVRAELRESGSWTVVAEGEPPPPAGISAFSSMTLLRDTFKERDSKALGYIQVRLSPRLRRRFEKYTTSKELWDALEKEFSE